MADTLSEQLQDGELRDAVIRAEQLMIEREHEEALVAYLAAMQIAVDTVGSRAPVVGDISCILSGLYEVAREDNVQAARLLTYALSIVLDELGYENLSACKIFFNLGRLHKALGNNELAEDAFILSLGAVGGEIEGDDPVVSFMFTTLGDYATARGDITAARQYFLKAQGAVRPSDWGVQVDEETRHEMEDRLLAFYEELPQEEA